MVKPVGLDYEKLVESLKTKKASKKSEDAILADSVRSHMKKVAFDVYNLDNDPYDGLWKLESNADDGKDYLIRMDIEGETKTAAWTAMANDNGTSITLSYKNVPIQRLSGKIFGFDKSDVGIFKTALVEKVAKDDSFRHMIFDMLPDSNKTELVKIFPELATKKR